MAVESAKTANFVLNLPFYPILTFKFSLNPIKSTKLPKITDKLAYFPVNFGKNAEVPRKSTFIVQNFSNRRGFLPNPDLRGAFPKIPRLGNLSFKCTSIMKWVSCVLRLRKLLAKITDYFIVLKLFKHLCVVSIAKYGLM